MALTVIPVPSTYAAGIVRAPELTGDVSDAVAWLSRPPLFIGAQLTAAQTVTTAAGDTAVRLDTEITDTVAGHLTSPAGSQSTYYAMEPGWYLIEGSAPLNFTGTTGGMTTGIKVVSNGTTLTVNMGERCPCNGQVTSAQAALLAYLPVAGTYGTASNDSAQLMVNQNATGTGTLFNGSGNIGRSPYLSLAWVATAGTGTSALPAPVNNAWPVPPAYVTSAILNASVRDTISFLIYPPMLQAYYTGSGTLASATTVPATGTAISLATSGVAGQQPADTYAAYSGSTWTVPQPGVYYCYGQVGLTGNSTSLAMAAGLTITSGWYNSGSAFTLWGGTIVMQGSAGANNAAIVRQRLRLNAGDTVQLAGYQHDSGGNAATLNNHTSEWATRLITIWRSA
jgi:hypothetical protein